MARAMKDSGVAWIGKMPADWELHRMKNCIADRTSGAWGNEAAHDDGDIVCLRIADFDYSRFRFKDTPTDELTIRNYDQTTIDDLLLRNGDILIEKSGGGEKTPVGRTVIFDKDYSALYANFMDRLRCSGLAISEWMQYVFVTFYKNEYSRNYIKQTTGIQNLDLTSMLANERMPVPTLKEQRSIVSLLDTECARIDAVIEQTRASIEEYKKLKQAVITQAVTKGIRPNRPMKDSGIDWVGDIPESYKVERVKHLGSYRNGLTFTPDDVVDEGQGTLVLRSSNVKQGKLCFDDNVYVDTEIPERLMVQKGDIIICSRNGSRELIGKCAIVEDDLIASFGAFMMIFRSNSPKYMYYILNSSMFKYYLSSFLTSTINQLTGNNFGNMSIVWCHNAAEQNEIVDFLDKETSSIDALISQKDAIIKELESFKKALIFEYVTGKKEVQQ